MFMEEIAVGDAKDAQQAQAPSAFSQNEEEKKDAAAQAA